ncbi:hypothetical protein SAMN05519103_08478 [Rhizobiales bacterium GAS113]|nr:hypothetical protein SAMN05519103_08478 [Rhizobiales bacterium GAS113]
MSRRALIVVTHLLGVGHLARAALIARALAERGAEVRLVSGGRPSETVDLAGLDLVQLPPGALRRHRLQDAAHER